MAGKQHADPVGAFFAAVAEVTQGALTDVRQEVVERAWFGRALHADASPAETSPEPAVSIYTTDPSPALPGGVPADWKLLCDKLEKERGHEPAQEPEHAHDLER